MRGCLRAPHWHRRPRSARRVDNPNLHTLACYAGWPTLTFPHEKAEHGDIIVLVCRDIQSEGTLSQGVPGFMPTVPNVRVLPLERAHGSGVKAITGTPASLRRRGSSSCTAPLHRTQTLCSALVTLGLEVSLGPRPSPVMPWPCPRPRLWLPLVFSWARSAALFLSLSSSLALLDGFCVLRPGQYRLCLCVLGKAHGWWLASGLCGFAACTRVRHDNVCSERLGADRGDWIVVVWV